MPLYTPVDISAETAEHSQFANIRQVGDSEMASSTSGGSLGAA